jgi:hypothetical protein
MIADLTIQNRKDSSAEESIDAKTELSSTGFLGKELVSDRDRRDVLDRERRGPCY